MIHDLNSINRIMSVVEDLKIRDETSNEQNVKVEYLGNYFLPIIDNASEVIEFCGAINLISKKDSRLSITNFGKEFLSLNPPLPYRKYELTSAQKKYILFRIISSEKYLSDFRILLGKFSLNEKGQLSLNNFRANPNISFLLQILNQLDFWENNNGGLVIKEEYENEILIYNLDQGGWPLAKFLENKIEESIRGSIAEHYALNYEKRRLENKKAQLNSLRINLISSQNVSAGYDIASFDSGESKDFDRFIEVKSSQFPKVHFFISKNEVKKARERSNQYWIYYVEMRGRQPNGIRLFQNPIETIIKNEGEYNIEYSTLEITQK